MSLSGLEEAVSGARESKIFAKRLALVLAEAPTLLEFWNNVVHKVIQIFKNLRLNITQISPKSQGIT